MNVFLKLSYLFFIGSLFGWILEVFYRKWFSGENPEHRWINPGFCVGPYLPIYGFGLCVLFLLASWGDVNGWGDSTTGRVLLFFGMAVGMTAIEYIAGVMCLRIAKVRLWDYSTEWGNIQGIICPKFSFIWAVMGAIYSFLIHPHILDALRWLSQNLAFSFVIGLFFGVFIIDVANSAQLIVKLKKFAEDNDVIVRYENIKAHIRSAQDRAAQRHHFFHPFRSERPLHEYLEEMRSGFEHRARKYKKKP